MQKQGVQVQVVLLLLQQLVVVLRAVVRPHVQEPVLGAEEPLLGHQGTAPATLLAIQQHALVVVLLFGARFYYSLGRSQGMQASVPGCSSEPDLSAARGSAGAWPPSRSSPPTERSAVLPCCTDEGGA